MRAAISRGAAAAALAVASSLALTAAPADAASTVPAAAHASEIARHRAPASISFLREPIPGGYAITVTLARFYGHPVLKHRRLLVQIQTGGRWHRLVAGRTDSAGQIHFTYAPDGQPHLVRVKYAGDKRTRPTRYIYSVPGS